MIQIAWILADETGNVIDARDFIIKPEGFVIPKAASDVHGITTEKALSEGKDLYSILLTFNELINEANHLVAHNISFDEKIVGAEFIRKNIRSSLFKKPRLCTMNASTDYCKIPGPYGYKWPKLSELHLKLFGEDFDNAHDAAADIGATAKCFWALRKKGII
jgi:DNA polymerase III epsilon subunit-like protein